MNYLIEDFKKTKDYLVCVDSDGCVFDNMELKHKECFCPATVYGWRLQGVSKYVREAAEFVNLYSKTRGANRFPAVIRTLELVYNREVVKNRGYKMPDLSSLKDWIKSTPNLSASSLRKYITDTKSEDPILNQALLWCDEVDKNVKHIVNEGVPPFSGVHEALEQLRKIANIVVVSATPSEALVREWKEQDLLKHVDAVCGQEVGTKENCIKRAMAKGFEAEKTLMIGDAIGDFKAAKNNNCLFFPIIPNQEEQSWQKARLVVSDKLSSNNTSFFDAEFELFDSVLLDEPNFK